MKLLLAFISLAGLLLISGYSADKRLALNKPDAAIDWDAAVAAQTKKGQGKQGGEDAKGKDGGKSKDGAKGKDGAKSKDDARGGDEPDGENEDGGDAQSWKSAGKASAGRTAGAKKPAADEEAKPKAKKPALEYDRSQYQPALVLIEGDKGSGTAFICKVQGIPFIVTNIHVLASADASRSYGNGLDKLTVRTLSGQRLTPLAIFGAVGHDLCIIRFAEENEYADVALEFETGVGTAVHTKDDIVIPGNSKGGGVMVWTEGEVVGIGPDRIEHNAPVYSGNSGSPIIHIKSKKVVGVLSYAEQVAIRNFVDKKSFNDERSAIQGDVRYFGFRMDSPTDWYQIDLPRFIRQNDEMTRFVDRRECVAAFLYTDDEDWRSDVELTSLMSDLEDLIRSRSIGGRVTRDTILQANISLTRRLEVLIKDDSYRNYTRYLHEHRNRHGGSQSYYPYFLDKIEREVRIRDHLARNIQEWETRVRRYMR